MKTKDKPQQITEHEFRCIMGDALAETIDYDILVSENQLDKAWFKRMDDVIRYILYNYCDIDITIEINRLAKGYLEEMK
jgi:hypothetical protein